MWILCLSCYIYKYFKTFVTNLNVILLNTLLNFLINYCNFFLILKDFYLFLEGKEEKEGEKH